MLPCDADVRIKESRRVFKQDGEQREGPGCRVLRSRQVQTAGSLELPQGWGSPYTVHVTLTSYVVRFIYLLWPARHRRIPVRG